MQKGLIYVEQISERLKYIEITFFTQRDIPIVFTNNLQSFREFEGSKLNYSHLELGDCETLIPAAILSESKIRNIDVSTEIWQNQKVLSFDTIPDPLGTLFYLISRYEEYLPSVRDMHDRYLAKNSVQTIHFDLNEQTSERVLHAFLANYFGELFHEYKQSIQASFVPTFDIDNTFAFQWKEGWRSWLSGIKDFLNGNKERRILRKQVQAGERKDPYDSFEEIRQVFEKHEGYVFWLLGDLKQYDKNIAWNHPKHQRLIREIDKSAEVGLHPSYVSNVEPSRLGVEKNRLETILSKRVSSSRQHFLKLNIPLTYERLLENEFSHDYSMGYAEITGFRAGTAHPFRWFNLVTNSTTELWIHPFAYMDGTLNEYLKLAPKDAVLQVNQLIKEVKTYGGDFSFLWHNESFAESGIWKGWRTVYEESEYYWNNYEQ